MSLYRVDTAELRRRLDDRRTELGISWRKIARDCVISPMALSRLRDGTAPDAHSLLTLLLWLDPDSPVGTLAIQPGAADV